MGKRRKFLSLFSIKTHSQKKRVGTQGLAFLFLLGLISIGSGMTDAQTVFPGAEGFGTLSRSAYGGKTLPRIIYVENLNSSGPGSFRAALSLPFPRIILFKVSGTIHTSVPLIVTQPYLFVAGQTASGKGITFSGAPFIVETHDVLIQSVRFRLGSAYQRQSDCVSITGTERAVYNVVFDHCSFAFGLDENVGILNSGPGITISNSIIGFALNELGHSSGLLALNVKNLSLIRNVFAFNRDRNPNVRGGSNRIEIVNNLIYNSSAHAVYIGSLSGDSGAIKVLLEGNLYITGSDNMNEFLLSVHREMPDTMQIYWSDNETVDGTRSYQKVHEQLFDQSGRFFASERPPFEPSKKNVIPAASLRAVLLKEVGPKPAPRDPLDSLIISNILGKKGRIIKTEEELALPSVDSLPYAGSSLLLPCDPHDYPEGSGFTNLERFLNELIK